MCQRIVRFFANKVPARISRALQVIDLIMEEFRRLKSELKVLEISETED